MTYNFLKKQFSTSTNGRPIGISATASPGTLIHTAVTGSIHLDEVYVYAVNNATGSGTITVEQGGSAEYDRVSVLLPPSSGSILVIPGAPLNGGLEVRAYFTTSGSCNVTGWVNRIEDL